MTKDYQYILFDWDGCLANTLPIWLAAYKEVCSAYGVYPSDEEIIKKAFGDWQAEKKFGISDHDGFVQQLRAFVLPKLPAAPLHTGVKETLIKLAKSHKLAIITSSRKENLTPALKLNEIEDLFIAVITTEDLKHDKPDPEGIEKALEKLRGNKAQAIIIGDSIKDITAGKNAGITTAVFYPEANHALYTRDFIEIFKADYIMTDLKELENIV